MWHVMFSNKEASQRSCYTNFSSFYILGIDNTGFDTLEFKQHEKESERRNPEGSFLDFPKVSTACTFSTSGPSFLHNRAQLQASVTSRTLPIVPLVNSLLLNLWTEVRHSSRHPRTPQYTIPQALSLHHPNSRLPLFSTQGTYASR